MGITWKITMVLLSTLAALVIIVHSAEEEYENQYRRELRPRSLDTGTRRLEQPWRTLEVEPVMQQASSSHSREELEDLSLEEPVPRRRRPGRKRKRRPVPDSPEESNERLKYSEEYRPRFAEFSNEGQPPEMPKRRRKKIEQRIKWAESLEEDRPMRRRGQRRKRPIVDTAPTLGEFNEHRPTQTSQVETELTTEPKTEHEDRDHDNDNAKVNQTPTDIIESREALLEIDTLTDKIIEKHPTVQYRPVEKDESSYSDSSNEYSELTPEQRKSRREEIIRNSKINVPIDPLTLKDILKKSNGTSLSEILQQHNLSLADLLHGKELALEILKTGNTLMKQLSTSNTPETVEESSEEKLLVKSETKYVNEPVTDNIPTIETTTLNDEDVTTVVIETTTTVKPSEEPTTRASNRRYPNGIRRKQRVRPAINNYKSQINRDMIALTSRKYFYNGRRRNATKSQEWKDIIPLMKNVTEIISEKPKVETTTANIEVTTVYEEDVTTTDLPREINETSPEEDSDNEAKQNETQVTLNETQVTLNEIQVRNTTNETDQPKTILTIPETLNTEGLRRQAFNNVLKKKRRKQKNSTAEPPQQDNFMKNIFGIPNLVSSSEFISRTQGPKTSLDDVTILEDFITTEIPRNNENKPTTDEVKPNNVDEKKRRRDKSRKIRYTTRPPNISYKPVFISTTTEESAKIEIEEILNDTGANAKLSRILKERNMTLNELVEHRERGSSHVHLADIFHNASREPNPPEPFLSKSAIEPISKETYPLRALLDAHDTTTKATTIERIQDNDVHIEMNMGFENRVNENVENGGNMGIMSLFHNITRINAESEEIPIRKDSKGTPYSTSIIVVNANDDDQNETTVVRESRVMHSINSNPDDIVGWNEIFSIMRRSYENKTKELIGLVPAETLQKASFEEDSVGDGVIILDDLQRLNEFNKIESIENQKVRERTEAPNTGTLDKQNHVMNTKSVTLATASIFGLALVLFLLTYVTYRWRQQRNQGDKNNCRTDEVIPTPVFENRKGHKNNSSTRSISPMITSNIYTLSTLDSQNGKESPDYMWDSLRKPFQ